MHRLHEQDQAIQTVVREARIEECTRAIKAVCVHCADGFTAEVDEDGHWMHAAINCYADALHERLAELRNP
jgi:hypothetical protein